MDEKKTMLSREGLKQSSDQLSAFFRSANCRQQAKIN